MKTLKKVHFHPFSYNFPICMWMKNEIMSIFCMQKTAKNRLKNMSNSLKRSCRIMIFTLSRGKKKAVFFPPWQFWFLMGTKRRMNNLKICRNIFDFERIFSQIFYDFTVNKKKFQVQWKKVLRSFLTCSSVKKKLESMKEIWFKTSVSSLHNSQHGL